MTIAFWCVLAAALMPLAFAALAKSGKGFDNAQPRDYLAALDGWRKRANAAQLNAFEAFPVFAAAVIIAHIVHAAPQSRIDALAAAFIVLRVLYGICYIINQATLRSIMWIGAMACVIALFVVSA
jgi:uncharacterized MAPEG superfamily protein